ncbi:hypothetical protein XELAEV_18010709mg [Xenopus laevis]|uniref:GIY-YIG domain-containing protein n=1 Tax=Xenopus laevis TaxID=8355 RepID=A0A974DVW0_XENLA|nr:hypothetical protein XELAEV_18010709mg [Xenopus laevis]
MPLSDLFSNFPRYSYKKGKSIRDTCSSVGSDRLSTPFKGKAIVGTFPCMECNCCSSIIKGPNINHPTSGQEIKLNAFATCKTTYVIYVLKCPCGMLYVGKSIRPVNVRIKEHKGNIRNFKVDSYSDTSVSRHFHRAKHNVCQLKWKVLETVPKPIRGGDHSTILLQREARWIRRFESTQPKG